MVIDVKKVESAFDWESFKDGKPYLGTYKQEVKGRVKMMTQKLNLDDWIKIDSTYPSQQREKERLLETIDKSLVFVSNEDETTIQAKAELLQCIIEYLPKRFPDKFIKTQKGVFNKMLGEEVDASPAEGEDPLLKASRLTQEDWCIMEWKEEEQAYVLTAGTVFFPMRWSLQEKWNQPMLGIHQPVDGFVKHLVKKVANLFKSMSPDAPVCRGNWSVFNDLEGPLDLYTPTGHEDRNANTSSIGMRKYQGEETGNILTFRTEYQTLRKLPKSRAIVFGIRTYQFYLSEFKKFPKEDTEILVNVIENLHPDFEDYKGAEFWKEASLKYLKRDVLKQKNNSYLQPLKVTFTVGMVALLIVAFVKRH